MCLLFAQQSDVYVHMETCFAEQIKKTADNSFGPHQQHACLYTNAIIVATEEYFMAHWIRTKPTYICIHSHTEIVIMIYKFSYITTTIIIEISISAHSSLLLLKLHLVIVHMILHGSKCAYWGVKYRGMARTHLVLKYMSRLNPGAPLP